MSSDPHPEYQRIPGRGGRRGGHFLLRNTSTLWRAPDHLLCIHNAGYSEEYRRFYFRDIQALLIQRTKRSSLTNVGLAGSGLLLALLGVWTGPVASAVFLTLAGVVLLGLVVNLARGPSCVTMVRTAVQLEELPSLNRLRKARQALRLLTPLIEQAQGVLEREQIEPQFARLATRSPEQLEAALPPLPPGLAPGKPAAQRWLFALLLVYGLSGAGSAFWNSLLLVVIHTMLFAALVVLCVTALARQPARPQPGVRMWLWGIGGYLAVQAAFSLVMMVLIAVENPDLVQNDLEYLRAFAEVSPFDSAPVMVMTVISVAGAGLLGLAGLISLRAAQPSAGPRDGAGTPPRPNQPVEVP